MPRSHPPSLLTLARRLVREAALFEKGQLVLCACSGGPDSTAMLHALALMRKSVGHELAAVGIDHGLRAEAASELELAARVARDHGVPFEIRTVAVEPGSNLMARARAKRFEALEAAAARLGAAVLAVGHTADDRAETFLIRLLRGAGPRGLAVMPPRSASPLGNGRDVVRPLLAARRSDVKKHLERHRLRWAEDPSNRDRRFLRARVRHELMPLLEELSPGVVGHLCAVAAMLHDPGGAPGVLPEHPTSSRAHVKSAHLNQLNRAQRLAIERALRLAPGRAKPATVRVSGGRDLDVNFFRSSPVEPGNE